MGLFFRTRRLFSSRAVPAVLVTFALAQLPAPPPAEAQSTNRQTTGTIVGLVLDAKTELPVPGARITVQGAGSRAESAGDGRYTLSGLPSGTFKVKCRAPGYQTQVHSGIRVLAGTQVTVDCRLKPIEQAREPVAEEIGQAPPPPSAPASVARSPSSSLRAASVTATSRVDRLIERPVQHDTEAYDPIDENPFRSARQKPLSTFSIDVDTASYANTRRFIEQEHRLPPKDAVRIEELLNYFTYDYPGPAGEHPFAIWTEVSTAPWNPAHRLVLLGLQGKRVATEDLPPNNLVFLIDTSGSMSRPNKLPLLRAAFKLLVGNLRPQDRVSIVVYAGSAGLVLPPTPGSDKERILRTLDQLQAGGSTAGGAGIALAYEVAQRGFLEDGNNRVVLATDGDFNVGASSNAAMMRLIEEKRDSGIFLSVLGFGTGNYQDSKMELLADHGNGNASYIDSILEAKKVLVSEMGGTLFTIAQDVKIQVEFNPARVKGYRLIGYENRLLRDQDFNDDTKDAGELGAGHSVTVLYELVPASSSEELAGVDELKYQDWRLNDAATESEELLTVKLRYKRPGEEESRLITEPLEDRDVALARTSNDFRFATAVAELGLLLRDSELKGDASYEAVLERARGAMAEDVGGYRADFVRLAESARLLASTGQSPQ